MAQNKLKSNAPSGGGSGGTKKAPRQLLFGNFGIGGFYLFENIQFVFYLAFLGVIYIANSHYAMKTIKEIKVLQDELKRISWESNSRKSELMYESMQSRVADKVQHLGLKELSEQPKKILVK